MLVSVSILMTQSQFLYLTTPLEPWKLLSRRDTRASRLKPGQHRLFGTHPGSHLVPQSINHAKELIASREDLWYKYADGPMVRGGPFVWSLACR